MKDLRICQLLVLLPLLVATGVYGQTFSVLDTFGFSGPEYTRAPGIIAQGRDGNLYTTSNMGGSTFIGDIYKIAPTGAITEIYSFDGSLGCYPFSGLTLGLDGNFYGTQTQCSGPGHGSVFKVTPGGSVTTLYFFMNSDGAGPYAPPIQGADGNFYGTTNSGGLPLCGFGAGCGTIYKLTPSGQLTSVHQFDVTHGYLPIAPLVQGTDGNFYGTAEFGGTNNAGVIFKITPSGFSVLHNFDSTDGNSPIGPLIQANDGNFYGTTEFGGTTNNDAGVIFKMTPAGTLTVLHSLNGSSDGAFPEAGLVQASDGNFYGVAQDRGSGGFGTIFKITPQGNYSVLHNFAADGSEGELAQVTLTQHTNGILYGDTSGGGSQNCQCGTFYSLNAGLRPFVSFLPASGKVSAAVEILGQGFSKATGVLFNGTSATFKVIADTYMTATVPNGATSGLVKVTGSGGTLTSNKAFRVTPQVVSFFPTSGPVGTLVTITGVSLTQAKVVVFGDTVPAQFTVNSDTQVTATVPSGAKTGPIGVETLGGTAISSQIFTVQ